MDRAVILDCTLRDGSYSVDFKFTASDTAALAQQLANLGIDWIEIGHGLGLGAMEAGKGDMPATDLELIRAAKARTGRAKIGMFLIPAIASRDQLARARDAGLDFIRIGDNAPDVEKAFPYLEYAKTIGLSPSLNMMKSYAITPGEFAAKTRGASEAGADIVYCVDSAGCMLPDDVARYFDAARNVIECPMGFHGHNGLMMSVANCIRAYEHGARFIDTTLCGLGRGAGNTPTEVLVAVFDQLGIPTGIDFFDVMAVAEDYVQPLVGPGSRGAIELLAARSRFHSSFIPPVQAVAARHRVDLRRLIAEAGAHDPVRLDPVHLEATASALAAAGSVPRPAFGEALLQFDDLALAAASPANPAGLARALVDGLAVVSAKRPGSKVVLHVAPGPPAARPAAEFLLADEHQVLGRITCPSVEALRAIVGAVAPDVSLLLVDHEPGWPADALGDIVRLAGATRVVPVRRLELEKAYLLEVLDRALALGPDRAASVLVYAETPLVGAAVASLDHGRRGAVRIERVDRPDAIAGLDSVDLVLCGEEPTPDAAARLLGALAPAGTMLILRDGPQPPRPPTADPRVTRLDLSLALCGVFERHWSEARHSGRGVMRD